MEDALCQMCEDGGGEGRQQPHEQLTQGSVCPTLLWAQGPGQGWKVLRPPTLGWLW